MNAGLSNLAKLKGYVLAAALRTGTDYDAALTVIGLGVAAAFENYCNRKFARLAGTTQIIAADRTQFLLSRYPVESVTKWELKTSEADGFIAQALTDILTVDLSAGIIYLPERGDVGKYFHQVRFTFSGGYFFELLEPADQGYPTAVPSGAALLPDDLQLAWLMQCAEVWKKKDKLGQGIAADGEKTERLSAANLQDKLLPEVESILAQYRRYNLT